LLSPEIDGILSYKLACIDHSPRWVIRGVENVARTNRSMNVL